MDITKRSILWIVFSVSLFLLWNQWLAANGEASLFAPAAPAKVVPGAAAPATPGVAAAPGAPAVAGAPGAPVAPAVPAIKTEVITITTDLFKVDVNTAGGVITRLELLKFADKIDKKQNQLLMNVNDKGAYVAKTGLTNGFAMPDSTTPFVAKQGPRSLDSAQQVELVLEGVVNNVKVVKTFTFKRGDYVIDVRHDVTNGTGGPIAPKLVLDLEHHGNPPEGESYFTASYTGPTMSTPAQKYQKLQFKDIEKQDEQSKKRGQPPIVDHETRASDGWIAISQHYFVSAFLPTAGMAREIETKKVGPNLYSINTKLPLGTIAPGATVTNKSRLYSGPQDEKKLEVIAPELDRVKDYGWATPIAKPIFWVMDQIHKVLGNWGWTIIVFTILIKLLFFPLSAAGYKSMARIKVVTPKMQAIREKYKGDPAKMNQATMELYKTEKINPLGGCLPILVQMPVFIALYFVLQASAEMRGAPWALWITDLTAPDPYFVLPVLYAISMYITTKLNPAPADPIQAKMMLFMPLIFSVMFVFFPSGLVLYWVVNNILSIGQQWVITKKFEDAAATAKK